MAGTRIQMLQPIVANGNGSGVGSGGGNGGSVYLESRFGDLTVSASVSGEGAAPDGTGGDFLASSRGALTAASAASISVRSNGDEGSGGDVWMDAYLDISTAGTIFTPSRADGRRRWTTIVFRLKARDCRIRGWRSVGKRSRRRPMHCGALEAWSARLDEIVSGERRRAEVVPMVRV